MTYFEDVGDFQKKFLFPRYGVTPQRLLTDDELTYRLGFHLEEITEFCQGHSKHDLAECADALVDLVYVVLGTAHFMGIPFDHVWNVVHEANMQKVPGVGKRGHRLDVTKPKGWQPPDVARALEHGAAFARSLIDP